MPKTVYKYRSKSKTLKDGSIKTTTTTYRSGEGWKKSTTITPPKTTGVNLPTGAGGAAAIIAIVGAGIKVAKQIAKGRAANEVKDLDDSIRNVVYLAGENLEGEEND